jgi:uncharacterized membrane protein
MLGPHVPFIPQLKKPDAIVIFGTDVYDKLILLKFLKQALGNCAYFTTDLDALYWHPHYIQYTKDLIVASQFPLTMSPAIRSLGGLRDVTINAAVIFRDSYQASVYWAVRKVVQGTNLTLNEALFAFPDKSLLYRVGNSVPLPLDGIASESQTTPEANLGDTFERTIGEFYAEAGGLIEPIIQGASPFWAIVIQFGVIAIGLFALCFDIRRRVTLSSKVREELWQTALGFVPVTLRDDFAGLRSQIKTAFDEKPFRVWRRQKKVSHECKRLGANGRNRNVAAYSAALIVHYQKALNDAATKKDVSAIGLNLLSDLFSFRQLGTMSENVDTQRHEQDVKPFADYVARGFFASFDPLDLSRWPTSKEGLSLFDRVRAVYHNLFPSLTFRIVGSISLLMLVVICMQPTSFLVGPETRSYQMRVFKWMLEGSALGITFCVFHRICFEQWRFRCLVEQLRSLITERTGLSNRQLVLLIADASVPVAHLSLTPCALVFLLFISHMVPLGGVRMTLEMFVLLFGSLCVLAFSFASLRSTALGARAQVRSDYDSDRITALRLITRLKSFATGKKPIQDDIDSLREELKGFVSRNSTSLQAKSVERVYARLGNAKIRQRVCDYLESCSRRNAGIIEQLGNLTGGVLAPLPVNPIISALLIPVGGAGGISLIAWIISQVR